MSSFGRALVSAARVRCRLRSLAARFPRPVQELTLRRLLKKAERTSFGQFHGFSAIRNGAEFRRRLPLRGYAEYKPWFERSLRGEANVTWPGRIRYFGMTSGTTSGNKYLPISSELIANQRRCGFDPIASYLDWTGDTELLDGKAMLLGGSATLDRNEHGVLIGDNTGIMAAHMPKLVEKIYRPSRAVRELRDWNQKIAAVARESMHEDVRLLAGTPGWFPGLLDRVIAEARAAGRNVSSIREVWPNLKLITGGGIGYEPYRPLIEARIGRSVPYVDVYNATEGGIMGIQDRSDDRAMLLLADAGVYYEFVPLEELGASEPRRLPLWEVERDVVYALALTTSSGIFGYLIGDCVRFVETFPHRFLFEGRTSAFLNTQGEHVSQGELEAAVSAACGAALVELADFAVACEVRDCERSARHVFYVEWQGGDLDLVELSRAIDAGIRLHNDDYATHRDAVIGLDAPLVRRVPAGTFRSFMQRRGKLGGQNKVPRVLSAADQQVLEEAAQALSLS